MKKLPLWIVGIILLFISFLTGLGVTVVPSMYIWFYVFSLFSFLGGGAALTLGVFQVYEDKKKEH